MKDAVCLLMGWNLTTFLLMAADKRQAVRGRRRIRERTLLTAAFAMGGVGCLLGAAAFHHKTKKWKFRLLLPTAVLFNLALLYLIYYLVRS